MTWHLLGRRGPRHLAGVDLEEPEALAAERRAMEEAHAAVEARGQFLARISHEMRTPLHGILGMADLLLSARLEPAQREQAELIRTSSETLLSLVNDILDFSRLEAGRLPLAPCDFDLRQLARLATSLLAPRAAAGVELRLCIAADLPERFHGDQERLRQVLLNLLGNAIRYTRRGHVEVVLESAAGANGGRLLRCEVRDTGTGIQPEMQARLFHPYVRSPGSGSWDLGGTGLGLVIAKGIVEQMGGRIGLASTPGLGSTFWFEVPLTAGSAAREEVPAAPREPQARVRHGRVLVVDDHPVNRRVGLAQLASLGLAADAVEGGEEALAALAQATYDAVLLDCAMPHLDGYETCRRLRQREGARRHTPVIAVTAHSGEEARARCIAAGMDDFLVKPFQTEALAAVLDRWLSAGSGPTPAGAPTAAESDQLDRLDRRLAAVEGLDPVAGQELRQQVAEAFLLQGASDVETLHRALAAEDGAALAAAAHSLGGSSGILGAKELAAACARLETLARQGELAACRPLIPTVEEGFRAAGERLSAARSTAPH